MGAIPGYETGRPLGWLSPPGPVVKRLLLINAAVFVAELVAVLTGNWSWVRDYVALSGHGIRSLMLWQAFTYMFLHDPHGIFHILLNLLALWMFGREVEYELGPYHFLKLYLLGGVLGGAVWVAFNWTATSYVLGASGAVLAVCIAYATLYPERPITLLLFFVLPVTMKAKYWAWLAVAVVAYGCLMVSHSSVADLAHLGGILMGYLYVKWLGYGITPAWITALQRVFPQRRKRESDDGEFHSSRPGVAYNHPYRTFDEEEGESSRPSARPSLAKLLPGRERRPEREVVDKDEFIRKEIDPILDKISKHGIQSLTRRERKILESAREIINKRP